MVKTKTMYQIGEISKLAGISVDSIRFYEKEKLIRKPVRSTGGFRLYDASVIGRIQFIKKAQSFGLSLAEINGIMQKSNQGLSPCCNHVSKVLERKLSELEKNIRDLELMKRNLKSLIKSWIPMKDAKKQKYVVCPQIENERINSRRRKRHVKKKS